MKSICFGLKVGWVGGCLGEGSIIPLLNPFIFPYLPYIVEVLRSHTNHSVSVQAKLNWRQSTVLDATGKKRIWLATKELFLTKKYINLYKKKFSKISTWHYFLLQLFRLREKLRNFCMWAKIWSQKLGTFFLGSIQPQHTHWVD